jgi:hypothetical protein
MDFFFHSALSPVNWSQFELFGGGFTGSLGFLTFFPTGD